MKIARPLVLLMSLTAAGCGTPSYESGEYDRDADAYPGDENRPSSLIEVSFGDGDAEVTKNIPADAAERLGDAVKTLRGKSPADVTGE